MLKTKKVISILTSLTNLTSLFSSWDESRLLRRRRREINPWGCTRWRGGYRKQGSVVRVFQAALLTASVQFVTWDHVFSPLNKTNKNWTWTDFQREARETSATCEADVSQRTNYKANVCVCVCWGEGELNQDDTRTGIGSVFWTESERNRRFGNYIQSRRRSRK